jgi:hypothetical protein
MFIESCMYKSVLGKINKLQKKCVCVCVWVFYIAWLKFIYMDDISCLIVVVYIFIFRKNLFRAYVCTVYQMSNQNKTFLSYLILSYLILSIGFRIMMFNVTFNNIPAIL